MINYFKRNLVKMFDSLWVYSFFRKTSFKVVTGGIVLENWVSFASHALVVPLLAPKFLMLGKS